MSYQPFLIADLRTGFENDIEPWLEPGDGFPTLEDAFMFRGRVRKKEGYDLLGRLVQHVAAEAKGNAVGVTFSGTLLNLPVSAGSVLFTVGAITFSDAATRNGILEGVPITNSGSINYETGNFVLNFSPAIALTPVVVDYDFHTGRPVMGLPFKELKEINQIESIAFDTVKANQFSNTLGRYRDISFYKTTLAVISWTGTDLNYFWSSNLFNALWSTNFVPGYYPNTTDSVGGSGDGIRWYDDTGWVNFNPQLRTTPVAQYLRGCLILIPYRGRMVALNTWEGDAGATAASNFPQRARWSQDGTPFYAAPVPTGIDPVFFQIDSWSSQVKGKGGFLDAPTGESIVSAYFLKDTLIVAFEASTWALRFTGNNQLPFYWEKINSELGAESTFSMVPFDKGVVYVGNVGVQVCDSVNVERIDLKIPNVVFDIRRGDFASQRVYGIRNYNQQLVYWAFPNFTHHPHFCDQILVYNYLDGSWSIFNDSFMCFGYYQSFTDRTWDSTNIAWEDADFTWDDDSGQSFFQQIIAGNQTGFVEVLNVESCNDPSLAITNMTTADQPIITTDGFHNLASDSFVRIVGVQGYDDLKIQVLPLAPAGSTTYSGTLTNKPLANASVQITVAGLATFKDTGQGTLYSIDGVGSINYEFGTFSIQFNLPLPLNSAVTAVYGQSLVNFRTYKIVKFSDTQFQILADPIVPPPDIPYIKSGYIIVVSNINITTKRFNPWIKEGKNMRIGYFDLFVESTTSGAVSMDIFPADNPQTPVQTINLNTQGSPGQKVWKRAYTFLESNFVQIKIYLSDVQMLNDDIACQDFVLHGLMLWMNPAGRIISFS